MASTRKSDSQETNNLLLHKAQGRLLLKLARSAIQSHLKNDEIRSFKSDDPALCQSASVFVTLWKTDQSLRDSESTQINAALRGCIGHLQSDSPLYVAVQKAAISAATNDPRFPPVSLEELAVILIEISILSSFTEVTDIQDIEVGHHGLLIHGLGRRGLLLPEVATRLNWDAETFFQGVCDKAGLPKRFWPNDAKLSSFTTTTFHE